MQITIKQKVSIKLNFNDDSSMCMILNSSFYIYTTCRLCDAKHLRYWTAWKFLICEFYCTVTLVALLKWNWMAERDIIKMWQWKCCVSSVWMFSFKTHFKRAKAHTTTMSISFSISGSPIYVHQAVYSSAEFTYSWHEACNLKFGTC